ncbi:MAG: hypothetical protein ACREJB_08980, partial [Planctomycetaceae bacterium]
MTVVRDLPLAFCEPGVVVDSWDDADLLRAVRWKRSAPQPLRAACAAGDVAAFTEHLHRHWLALHRRMSKAASKHAPPLPVLWSRLAWPASERARELLDLCESLAAKDDQAKRKPRKESTVSHNGRHSPRRAIDRLRDWVGAVEPDAPLSPCELAALLDLWPLAVRDDDAALAWRLWRSALVATAELSRSLDDPAAACGEARDQTLIVRGELPWRAGLLFADLKRSGRPRRAGRSFLTRELDDRTDDDGTLHAELGERMPLWLAPLVRSAEWAARFDEPLFKGRAAARFRSLLT